MLEAKAAQCTAFSTTVLVMSKSLNMDRIWEWFNEVMKFQRAGLCGSAACRHTGATWNSCDELMTALLSSLMKENLQRNMHHLFSSQSKKTVTAAASQRWQKHHSEAFVISFFQSVSQNDLRAKCLGLTHVLFGESGEASFPTFNTRAAHKTLLCCFSNPNAGLMLLGRRLGSF